MSGRERMLIALFILLGIGAAFLLVHVMVEALVRVGGHY